MRVLMFGWEYPPYNSGGLGVACKGLAESLAARGIELTFVLPRAFDGVSGNGFKIMSASVPGLSQISVNSLLTPYLTNESYVKIKSKLPGRSMYGSGLFEEVERYAELAGDIAKNEPHDLIHTHDWLTFGAGMVASGVSGKPMIAHVHATEVDRTAGNVNTHIYEREREGVNAADRVVSVSDFTKRILINDYGVNSGKIDVVHNGIDTKLYSLDEEPDHGLAHLKDAGYKIVLYYGRITIMKGVDYLIHAAKQVIEKRPRTAFVIVGSGDMEGQIMEQVARLGISRNVLFPGFLRGRELSSVIRSADLFVCPSVSEPFGLTPLESLAHGVPVILSKQSGVSEVLSHVMKVDFWDTEEMADKILSVLKYSPMRSVMSTNGKSEAMGCSWDLAANKLIGVYNNLAL